MFEARWIIFVLSEVTMREKTWETTALTYEDRSAMHSHHRIRTVSMQNRTAAFVHYGHFSSWWLREICWLHSAVTCNRETTSLVVLKIAIQWKRDKYWYILFWKTEGWGLSSHAIFTVNLVVIIVYSAPRITALLLCPPPSSDEEQLHDSKVTSCTQYAVSSENFQGVFSVHRQMYFQASTVTIWPTSNFSNHTIWEIDNSQSNSRLATEWISDTRMTGYLVLFPNSLQYILYLSPIHTHCDQEINCDFEFKRRNSTG